MSNNLNPGVIGKSNQKEDFLNKLKENEQETNNIKKDVDELKNFDKKSIKDVEVDLQHKEAKTEGEKVTISFKDNTTVKNFLNQKTGEAPKPEEDKDKFYDKTPGQIKDEVDVEKEEYTTEDFKDIAETLIDLIDGFASSGLRLYATDTTDVPYLMSDTKKKRLVKQLTRILIKYNKKFNLLMLFLITVIVTYLVPYKKARDMRKARRLQVLAEIERKKKSMEVKSETISSTIVQEFKSKDEIVEQKIDEQVGQKIEKNNKKEENKANTARGTGLARRGKGNPGK